MADPDAPGPGASLPDGIARLTAAARGLSQLLKAILAEDGLREDQWRVMDALAHTHGLLMGELARTLVLPPATTTRCVDELTDLGLVFRRPQPEDARKFVVYLSRTGYERYDRALSLLEAHRAELTELLGGACSHDLLRAAAPPPAPMPR
ncbi:MarR family winged helix-turn-helix transcriptional regulator [Streptomyces sp. NPDC059255]|uniref:MarR family winged helix-turn-helix transcriptional regulator n=1 Tax=Streptomyces sp. NPDC059255 TaxID=3346793 RepID=UPI0036CA30C9